MCFVKNVLLKKKKFFLTIEFVLMSGLSAHLGLAISWLSPEHFSNWDKQGKLNPIEIA